MAGRFTRFGNDLYTGKRSIEFVGKRRIWYLISAIALLLAITVPFLRGGYQFGIEFTGGAEYVVSGPESTDQSLAREAVRSVVPDVEPQVSIVNGGEAVRVQTSQLDEQETNAVEAALAEAYAVDGDAISTSFIGATWGADISQSAIRGLLVFLVLVAVFMALYFRTWKMAVAALAALFHDLIITAGVYGIVGFEVTPAAVIGFLTILALSLYDTVVVFDRIRENTAELTEGGSQTFAQSVNLAVNQTLVRSINTTIVALLPIAAILFIGATLLGAGTLRDISLALFIGVLIGTYSTVFLAAPLYVDLRSTEPRIRALGSRRAVGAKA